MGEPVTVCVATFRRLEGLRGLLDSLDALAFDGEPPDLEIVVVDNDPPASALQELGPRPSGYRWPVAVLHEPEPGIPQARNAGLRAAAGRGGYVAFVDDDEEVSERWLAELLRVAREHDAAAVAGPVVARLPADAPDWVERGGFFDRRRHATGASVGYFATNNALVRTRVLEELGGFDPRLALTGGSDRELSDRIRGAGHTIRWADDAVVTESVPLERATLAWILRRGWRLGNNIGVRARMPGIGSPRAALAAAAFALARLGYGLLVAASGAVRGRHVAARGARTVAAALGTLAGIAGFTYEEYSNAR